MTVCGYRHLRGVRPAVDIERKSQLDFRGKQPNAEAALELDFSGFVNLLYATLRTLVDIGHRSVAKGGNYECRAQIMWALIIARDNTLGVGREQDWSTHTIAIKLSTLYDPPPPMVTFSLSSWAPE